MPAFVISQFHRSGTWAGLMWIVSSYEAAVEMLTVQAVEKSACGRILPLRLLAGFTSCGCPAEGYAFLLAEAGGCLLFFAT